MSKYKDIFIDFDDTLYDTRGNAVIALKDVFQEYHLAGYGIDEQTFYDVYWRVNMDLWTRYSHGEITREHLIIERFKRPLVETSDAFNPSDEYCHEIGDRFLELCSMQPATVEGAHELVEYLHGKGYRLHLCSNGFHEVQYKKLRSCGLYPYFDTVILSEDVGVNKPQPAYFDYALEKSGAQRETTVMIGDNYYSDIVGAMDSGIDAILFQRWDPTFEPPRKVNYIADTLKEITQIL